MSTSRPYCVIIVASRSSGTVSAAKARPSRSRVSAASAVSSIAETSSKPSPCRTPTPSTSMTRPGMPPAARRRRRRYRARAPIFSLSTVPCTETKATTAPSTMSVITAHSGQAPPTSANRLAESTAHTRARRSEIRMPTGRRSRAIAGCVGTAASAGAPAAGPPVAGATAVEVSVITTSASGRAA
ncbi:hypothetical protein TSOC111612_24195 [Tsukamurella ocularis]